MVQLYCSSSELGSLLRDTGLGHPALAGPLEGEKGRERPGDGAAPDRSRQLWCRGRHFPSGEAPRAQQREPHSGESHRACSGSGAGLRFSNINTCTPGKSFSSLPPPLRINLRVAQKASAIISITENQENQRLK